MILRARTWGDPSARTVLMAHSATNSSATWTQLGQWFAGRGWHAVAVDLRGHGDSGVDPADAEPSVSAMAGDLIDTIAAHDGAEHVDLLVGHSLGAAVSLVCAVEHPSFVRRLVLEDPPGPASVDFVQIAGEIRANIDVARRDPEGFIRARFAEAPPELTDEIQRTIVGAVAAADPAYVPVVLERMADLDILGLAARCRVPALLLLGRDRADPLGSGPNGTVFKDAMTFSAMLAGDRRRFIADLPDAQVRYLETGHRLHDEAFEAYVEHLGDWLSRTYVVVGR